MPGRTNPRESLGDLEDVQVLGVWNFTMQADTPLHWLRTGPLERYLLRFGVHAPMPCIGGIVFHAEADGDGTDGISFWMERQPHAEGASGSAGTRRFVLAGEGLDSKPVVTRHYPDPGGQWVEDIEVLVQGNTAVVFLQNRKVQIRCRTKGSRGSVAFYNSTKAAGEEGADEIHFSGVRTTALRRGPLEVSGDLGRRERALRAETQADEQDQPEGVGMAAAAATVPRRSQSHARRTGGLPGRMARTQPRMGHSSSDSALRKSGGVLVGLGGPRQAPRGVSEKWVPMALNAPRSQQQLMRDSHRVMRPLGPSAQACNDFIAQPIKVDH